MRKNFSFIDFEEYTEGVLQEFIASNEDTMYTQNFDWWYDAEELRNHILDTTKLKCKIVVRKDCGGFHREVSSFDDVLGIYDELYGENLQSYFDGTTPEQIHEIMSYPEHECYEGFEDLVVSEYFKPPTEDDLDFWFDDYVYYICLQITKK